MSNNVIPRTVLDTIEVGEHIRLTAGTPTLKSGEPLTITVQLDIPFDAVRNLDELEAFIRPWMDDVFKSVHQAWDRAGVGGDEGESKP